MSLFEGFLRVSDPKVEKEGDGGQCRVVGFPTLSNVRNCFLKVEVF